MKKSVGMVTRIEKNLQYHKFCLYGFLKNLRFFDAFLVLFFLENGLDYLLIGVLYSIREITLAFTEIPSGVVADALGRRKTLVASFVFYILSFFLFYFANHFIWFATAMLVYALGDAFRTGVHKAMIFDYLKRNNRERQKVDYYGHTRSWSQAGTALSSLIAGIIVFYTGSFRLIFPATVIPYIADMFLVWSYPKYLDGKNIQFSVSLIAKEFREVINAFFHSFRKFTFIRVLTSSSLFTGYYRAVKDYIQPLLKQFALALPVLALLNSDQKIALTVGIIYFVIYLFTAVASHNAGRFTNLFPNYFKTMNLTIIFGFLAGIATGIVFSLNGYIAAIIGFVVILIIENLRKPVGMALVADLSKQKAWATTLSAGSQAKSLITALLAPVLGWLADRFNPGSGIAIVTLLLLVLFPVYLLKAEKKTT